MSQRKRIAVLILAVAAVLFAVLMWRKAHPSEGPYRDFIECVHKTHTTDIASYLTACKGMSNYNQALIPVLVDAFETRKTVAKRIFGEIGSSVPERFQEILPKPDSIENIHETARWIVSFCDPKIREAVGQRVVPQLLLEACDVENNNYPYRRVLFDDLRALNPPPKVMVTPLIGLLKDPTALFREKAAAHLSDYGDQATAAIPNLIALTSDEDSGVRESAVMALGSMGPAAKTAIPALKDCLKGGTSTNDRVKFEAAFSIWRIDTNEGPVLISFITQTLDDPKADWLAVGLTTKLLGEMAVSSESAATTLSKLREHPRKQVRDAAARVLEGAKSARSDKVK